jgi:hypothetical protein
MAGGNFLTLGIPSVKISALSQPGDYMDNFAVVKGSG